MENIFDILSRADFFLNGQVNLEMTAVIKEQTAKNTEKKEHIQAVAHSFHFRGLLSILALYAGRLLSGSLDFL